MTQEFIHPTEEEVVRMRISRNANITAGVSAAEFIFGFTTRDVETNELLLTRTDLIEPEVARRYSASFDRVLASGLDVHAALGITSNEAEKIAFLLHGKPATD